MGLFEQTATAVASGKSFTVHTGINNISGTSEHPYLLIKNPSDSGCCFFTTHFKLGIDATSVRSVMRIYANPTVTANGTALTIVSSLIESSPPTSLVEAYKDPTVTSNGQILNPTILPANNTSKGLNRFYYVCPGNYLLITVENSASNAATFVDAYWLENP